jgi:hypothetical protein
MSGHDRAADVLYKAAWAQVLPHPAASSHAPAALARASCPPPPSPSRASN